MPRNIALSGRFRADILLQIQFSYLQIRVRFITRTSPEHPIKWSAYFWFYLHSNSVTVTSYQDIPHLHS